MPAVIEDLELRPEQCIESARGVHAVEEVVLHGAIASRSTRTLPGGRRKWRPHCIASDLCCVSGQELAQRGRPTLGECDDRKIQVQFLPINQTVQADYYPLVVVMTRGRWEEEW